MIAALILSAGASQRMGQPKALLSIGGKLLLERIIDTARSAGVEKFCAVVAPPHDGPIRQRFADAALSWAFNPQPERGMLSSVQAGLPQLLDAACGTLIWPVDVPFVDEQTVRALLAAPRDAMVVPVCDGRGGHPLWLPRRLFAAAMALSPDVGLRALRQEHPPLRLDVNDAEILRDLDTPEDVEVARKRWDR